ncbi:uncharacterized protein P884DRAFT_297120 [Thermothelomyces heterothallicus CBS 202.75]|uniref:uncharacterized protein n=1 Tax=Thermothelomyces heterothallicus CBS 202.75 TaxID=1149848 RepID=UPI0037445C07
MEMIAPVPVAWGRKTGFQPRGPKTDIKDSIFCQSVTANVLRYRANIDASRITAAGWSCGGIEAYAQIWDDRVQSIGIWSSGLPDNHTAANDFTKPVFFFLGGPSDIAYGNGERDYARFSQTSRRWANSRR